MSYILNALRRSEQERQVEQAPDLEKTLLSKQTQHKSRKFLLIFILLTINLLTLIVFFWLYWQSSVTPPVTEASKHSIEVAQQSDQKRTESAAHEQKTAPLPKQWVVEKPSSFSDIIAKQKSRQSQLVTKPLSGKRTAAPAIQSAKKNQPLTPDKAPPIQQNNTNRTADSGLDIPQKAILEKAGKENISRKRLAPTLPQPTDKTANEKSPKHSLPAQSTEATPSIPYLDELSAEFRRGVPDIHINVFVYSDTPEERFIMVDMAKYKTGQKIADGVQLKKIERDNLVVEYAGKTFRIERP